MRTEVHLSCEEEFKKIALNRAHVVAEPASRKVSGDFWDLGSTADYCHAVCRAYYELYQEEGPGVRQRLA